jgi:hypothetical protein
MIHSTVRPILERLAYACYMMLLVCSIGITWLGFVIGFETGDYTAMGVALGGLALSRWLHVHGHAHWHFQKWEDSLDVVGDPGVIPRSEPEEMLVSELATLFERMEAEDDVWVRSELRREIAAKLMAAPRLREDFSDELARHPEI